MSRAVRDAIGGGAAADVHAGRASPARYQCVMCDGGGDARRDQTSVIVMRQDLGDILAYAHARVPAQPGHHLRGGHRRPRGLRQPPSRRPPRAT